MNAIRKYLCWVLTLCLLLGSAPAAVFAAEAESTTYPAADDGNGVDETSAIRWIMDSYDPANGKLVMGLDGKMGDGNGIKSVILFVSFDNTKVTLVNRMDNSTLFEGEEGSVVKNKQLPMEIQLKDENLTPYSATNADIARFGGRTSYYMAFATTGTPGNKGTDWQDIAALHFKVAEKPGGGFYTEEELGSFFDKSTFDCARDEADRETDAISKLMPGRNAYSLIINNGKAANNFRGYSKMAQLSSVNMKKTKGVAFTVSYPGVKNGPAEEQTPTAPTGLAAEPKDDGTKAVVSWKAPQLDTGVPPVDWYEVSGDKGIISTSTSATTLELSGLSRGTTYQITVKAHNKNGLGLGAQVSMTTFDAPKKPELTLSNGGALKISAAWTKPEGNGAAVTGYKLYVSTDAECNSNYVEGYGPKTISGADTLSEVIGSDTKLTDNTKYYVKVAAVNPAGETASDIQSFTALNVVDADTPQITVGSAEVESPYGAAATVSVSAVIADKGTLSYQWYQNTTASNQGGTLIPGAVNAAYTTPVMKTVGERAYYYCEATNTNNADEAIDQTGGSHIAKAKSEPITVTTVQKPLKAAGFAVKEATSIYNGGSVDLSTLLTMDAEEAGAIGGETVVQVLDLANANVASSAAGIVKFQTVKSVTEAAVDASGAAIVITTEKAVDVDYGEVVKTNGSYTYEVNIPEAGSSTNYILGGAVTGKGTLTVSKKSSGSGGGGGGGSSSGSTTTTGTEIKKDIPSSGSLTVSSSELKNAKSIEVKDSQITVALNQQAVNVLDKTTGLIVKTEKKSGITMNDAAKELLGSRPVFDVTATQNGKAVTSFGSGRITISITYSPASGEDTGKLFLYTINDKGEAEKVSGSKYDATLKAVTGQTNHLSLYAVGYDENVADTSKPAPTGLFRDVSSGDWFYTAVMELAGKEIISGVPDEDAKGNPIGTYRFNPQANVTRAEFATMLAKAAGVDLTQYSAKVFNDVSVNDWYAGAVAWANSAGVASGTGNGNFSPTANITRQDMAVMVSKYLTNVAKTTLTAKNEQITFTDAAQIAEYAKTAVEGMQTTGVISGIPNEDAKGNPIGTYQYRPFANATRAEAAAMLSGLLGAL